MDDRVEPLLLGGAQALWMDGDRPASRDWFDAAYRLAETTDDTGAMALAALGLSGLWLDEYRHTAAAVLVDARLRRAAAAVDPRSAFGLRLRARLAGEADHRTGQHAAILAVVEEARQMGDAVAAAEAASLAHQCLPGPEHRTLRQTLARELIAESYRTERRSDLLTGLLWQTVDLFADADPNAERHLADLKAHLARDKHPAVGFVVSAIDVMLSIRAGRLEQAETLADAAFRNGTAAGDADAVGWHGLHLLAIRWYQGRVAEQLPALRELANAPTLTAADSSPVAGLALTGDRWTAASALARLHQLPRSSTWLLGVYAAVEAAHLLDDGAAAAAAADLLHPFAHLPVIAGPAVACFGAVRHPLGVAALTTGDVDQAVTQLRGAVRDNLALGHRPAATLSRARLAQALAIRAGNGDAAEAEREHDLATAEAAELRMTLPTYQRKTAPTRRERRRVVCRRRGNRWVVELGHRTAEVADSVGMRYLAALLDSPGQEIPAIQLAAGTALPNVTSSNQPIIDETAKHAYRQRLSRLRADLDEYESTGDTTGAARTQAELDWLIAELKSAAGINGRPRTFTDSAELARLSAGKAIRRALTRVETADPVIGAELRGTITTGLRCCYRP